MLKWRCTRNVNEVRKEKEAKGMPLNREKMARRLVRLRGDKTRERVAGEVGISVSALQMYECGNRVPRDEIKMALAAYYRTSIEALFFDE